MNYLTNGHTVSETAAHPRDHRQQAPVPTSLRSREQGGSTLFILFVLSLGLFAVVGWIAGTYFKTVIDNIFLKDIADTTEKVPSIILNTAGIPGITFIYTTQILQIIARIFKKMQKQAAVPEISEIQTEEELSTDPQPINQSLDGEKNDTLTTSGSLSIIQGSPRLFMAPTPVHSHKTSLRIRVLAGTFGFTAAVGAGLIAWIQAQENDLTYHPSYLKYVIPGFVGAIEWIESILGIEAQETLKLMYYLRSSKKIQEQTNATHQTEFHHLALTKTRIATVMMISLMGLSGYSVMNELYRNLIQETDPNHPSELIIKSIIFVLSTVGSVLPLLLDMEKWSEFLQKLPEHQKNIPLILTGAPLAIAPAFLNFIIGYEMHGLGEKNAFWGSFIGTLCMFPKIITHIGFIDDFYDLLNTQAKPAVIQFKEELQMSVRARFPGEPTERQRLLPSSV